MLDPIADKVLVAVVLLVLAADRTISGAHIWAAIIILSREVLVSGLREFLAELRVSVPVTKVAKWKTTVQLVAVGFLIAGPAGDKIMPYVTEFGLAGLWIAAALTLYTGYDYFRAGIGHVMDGQVTKLLYFARHPADRRQRRRRISTIPADVTTVSALIDFLERPR